MSSRFARATSSSRVCPNTSTPPAVRRRARGPRVAACASDGPFWYGANDHCSAQPTVGTAVFDPQWVDTQLGTLLDAVSPGEGYLICGRIGNINTTGFLGSPDVPGSPPTEPLKSTDDDIWEFRTLTGLDFKMTMYAQTAQTFATVRLNLDTALELGTYDQFRDCNEDAAMTYDARQAEYRRLTLAGLETAPLQLAVFTVADPAEGDHLGRRTMPQTLEQSTAMAIHTLWLAARAENIGLGMVSILDPEAMERLFAVPADWSFSAYLCLGYPREHDDLPLLHRAGWQENTAAVWERR